MSKIIKFTASADVVGDKTIHPEPAKLHIPQWYKDVKNLPHFQRTIKICKPFLDSLLAGYILKNPRDQLINFNVDKDGKKQTWVDVNEHAEKFQGLNMGNEVHNLNQVGGMSCPYAQKNKGFNIYKLLNPWTVTLDKGYAALYTPPLNRVNDDFEILSGIVDGNHPIPTNFPIIFKKEGTWLLEKGRPIAMVFPFKLDNWKMKIEEQDNKKARKLQLSLVSKIRDWYKESIWSVKKWN